MHPCKPIKGFSLPTNNSVVVGGVLFSEYGDGIVTYGNILLFILLLVTVAILSVFLVQARLGWAELIIYTTESHTTYWV